MKLKKILIIVIALTTFICSLNSASFSANNEFTDNIFYLNFDFDEIKSSDNKRTFAENIRVDIYRSELTTNFDNLGIKVFEHKFAFSVYTNESGIAEFVRPSEYFYISIDITTLPKNTDIKETSKFYTPSNKDDCIIIYSVDNSEKNNIVTKPSSCFYDLIYKDSATSLMANEQSRTEVLEFVYNEFYRIKHKEPKYKDKKINNIDISELIEFVSKATEKNILTKLDCLKFLFSVNNEFGKNTEFYIVFNKLLEDSVFYDSLDEEEKNIIREIQLDPSYSKTYSTGYFIIFYNYDYIITPLFITSLAAELNAVYSDLITNCGMNQPKTTLSGTDKYYVFVSSETVDHVLARTRVFYGTPRTSYIEIPNVTSLTVSLNDYQKGSIAHEYMHAIMHDYKDLSQLPLWFVESWADWTIYKVYGMNSAYNNSNLANEYLQNIGDSLNSSNYVYGKVMYPLFLEQKYGGSDTVINVVKNLPTATDVYDAITSALPNNVTFDTAFPEFGQYIYAPKRFYNPYLTDWDSKPYILHSYDVSSYPTYEGTSISALALQYREFDYPTGMNKNLSITLNVNANENAAALKCKLFFNKTNGSFVTTSGFITIGSNITTIYACNPDIICGAVMVSNTSHSSYAVYYYSMSLS